MQINDLTNNIVGHYLLKSGNVKSLTCRLLTLFGMIISYNYIWLSDC